MDDPAVVIEVFRGSFVVHCPINDALKVGGPKTIPLGPESYEVFIKETRRRVADKKKKWEGLVHDDDLLLTFEGAAFRADGSLLLAFAFLSPPTAGPYPSSSVASSASSSPGVSCQKPLASRW